MNKNSTKTKHFQAIKTELKQAMQLWKLSQSGIIKTN